MPARRVAILGAGPIGLEAALEAARRGFEVRVYEAGQVGEHLRRFESVALFTPFGMNSSPEGRERLRSADVPLPSDAALLSAGELVENYLVPLARLSELAASIRERERVTHVGRGGLDKGDGVGSGRKGRGFLLRVEADGATRFDRADFVVDATGVYGNPNATGPGGLPALGEDRLGDALTRHIDPSLYSVHGPYVQGDTLLIGDGHSAATALLRFDGIARAGDAFRVHWIARARPVAFAEVDGDPLPARLELARRANEIASSAQWLTRHPGACAIAFERLGDRIHVALEDGSSFDVDRVLALVGYRPDLAITRELQVHYCYASEGTMKLAAAILGAGGGDCLAQVAHGAESLQNPEPDFFVLGAKSYGRNPQFLLSIGHQQVRDAFRLMGSGQGIAAPALVP